MHFDLLPRPLQSILLLALLTTSSITAAQKSETTSKTAEVFRPCQTRSPNSGSFFDLNPLKVEPLPEPSNIPDEASKPKPLYPNNGHRRWLKPKQREHTHVVKTRRKDAKKANGLLNALQEKDDKEKELPKSWHARGYDYPANFTMNFCGPVVEEDPGDERPLSGPPDVRWESISAFYVMDDKTFSLGELNTNLTWRGRKLTLNYTNGSPCPRAGAEQHNQSNPENWSKRRKSTLISLLCERDPLAPKVSIAFVGTNDECTYFFEARSAAACPALQIEKQQVGPSGVFAVIFVITVMVYFFGGIVYQRAVMHQRGWRQLPNYALWHGIFTFVQDLLIICFSSCGRCFGMGSGVRKPRGFNQVHPDGQIVINGGPRRPPNGTRSEEDDDRLLDELDEEWHN